MSSPIHPYVLEWIQDKNREDLLHKLRKAEKILGDFGTVTITYHDGKPVSVKIEKVEKI